MVVFVTYPVAPPRLAHLGLVDTVTRELRRLPVPPAPGVRQPVRRHAEPARGLGPARRHRDRHAPPRRSLLRAVGCVVPVLMALAVVATANHYVLDVVAGVALALVGHAVALRLERRRATTTRREPT